MSRNVVVVPHTHWDREWYLGFQTFRMKLVDLLDDLLPLLDSDPAYSHFMLDGQMAVVDDYLEVRPGEHDRLLRLATTGRLSLGPWYILMDEFLVSGETMIRDLELGIARAAGFGGASPVAYLPDMFGHVAQMPQLLAQFGFAHTVVWRGVPSTIDRNAFCWQAPDGSEVRAEYLVDGYGNGAQLPDDAKDLVAAIDRYLDRFGAFYRDDDPVLWMNGTDHLMPQPWLGRVVNEANDAQDRYAIRVGSLADHVLGAPTDDLVTHVGELRSSARANLLMGVASNRVDVKQAAAAAERWIERYAEPLSALFLPAERWPGAFLDVAWREIVRNSAHDSSCACSIDEVCDAVIHRYAEARQVGEGLAERAVRSLGASLRDAAPVIVNPSAHPRTGVVELHLRGHDDHPGTQVLRRGGGLVDSGTLTRAAVANLLDLALNYMGELREVELVTDDDGAVHVHLHADPDDDGPRYQGDAGVTFARMAEESPDAPASIAMVFPVDQRVLAHVRVDGFGWSSWQEGPLDVAAVEVVEEAHGGVTVRNGAVTVVVDTETGVFSLDGVGGYGRLVDEGDSGDTYNFNPAAGDAVDAPESVAVRVLERGPLRARIAVDRTYTFPEHARRGTRQGEAVTHTTTTLEVTAGSPLVSCATDLDNRSRDHRLRVHLPLPSPATSSVAECAFSVVERGLTAEGGPNEHGLPTYPSRRFVVAGGLTVVHDGLLEYELVDIREDGAHELALTLLRCTGLISQGPMPYRPAPAGPLTPTPGAQMPGRQVLRWAVAANDDVAAAYRFVDDAFVPLQVTRAPGGGDRPSSGSALQIDGGVVSSVRRVGGRLVVRVFNPTPVPATVRIDGRRGWRTDLRGAATGVFEGALELAPWKIATLSLDD